MGLVSDGPCLMVKEVWLRHADVGSIQNRPISEKSFKRTTACDGYGLTITVYLLFIALECWDIEPATASSRASVAYLFGRFQGCFGQGIGAGSVKE